MLQRRKLLRGQQSLSLIRDNGYLFNILHTDRQCISDMMDLIVDIEKKKSRDCLYVVYEALEYKYADVSDTKEEGE